MTTLRRNLLYEWNCPRQFLKLWSSCPYHVNDYDPVAAILNGTNVKLPNKGKLRKTTAQITSLRERGREREWQGGKKKKGGKQKKLTKKVQTKIHSKSIYK